MLPSYPSRSPAAEVGLYLQCEAWLAKILPPSALRSGGKAYHKTLATQLMLRVREGQLRAGQGARILPEGPALQAALGESIEAVAAIEPETLWLLTSDLIHRQLVRKLGWPAQGSQEEERLQALKGLAMEALEAGKQPLEAFRALGPREGHFWSYLQTCVRNAVIDQLRLKGKDLRGFWDRKAPAVHSRSELGTGAGGVQLHISTHPEGKVNRVYRALARAEAVELVAAIAQAHPQDRTCVLAGAFIDWMRVQPDGAPCSQAAFAEEKGLPKGTVNASMSRFRERYLPTIAPEVSGLYTTAGGGR